MATEAEIRKFFETIGPMARKEALSRKKWVLPSVCCAQAALETGYGVGSSLMIRANAYFGIKWTKGCGYKAYNSKTREVINGNDINITAAFRAYDSLEDSVKDYYDLITTVRYYKDMVNNPDYRTAVWGIDDNGDSNELDGLKKYATDPMYQRLIIQIIEKWNLTKYDEGLSDYIPEQKSDTYAVKRGAKVQLDNTPVYVSSTSKTSSGNRTGTYYYWDDNVINGRIRITNRPERVGVRGQVSCWINVS